MSIRNLFNNSKNYKNELHMQVETINTDFITSNSCLIKDLSGESVYFNNADFNYINAVNIDISGIVCNNCDCSNATTDTIYTNDIKSISQTLEIGNNSSFINLGCGPDTQTVNIGRVGGGTTNIHIGGPGDNVYIDGSLNFITSEQLEVKDKNIYLNVNGPSLSSINSGLIIQDNNIDAGFIGANNNAKQIRLKAPLNSYSVNTPILEQDTTMIIKDLSNQSINSNLSVLKLIGDISSNYIYANNIDISTCNIINSTANISTVNEYLFCPSGGSIYNFSNFNTTINNSLTNNGITTLNDDAYINGIFHADTSSKKISIGDSQIVPDALLEITRKNNDITTPYIQFDENRSDACEMNLLFKTPIYNSSNGNRNISKFKIGLKTNNTITDTSDRIYIGRDGGSTTDLCVNRDGNVCVNTSNDGGYKFNVNGNSYFNSITSPSITANDISGFATLTATSSISSPLCTTTDLITTNINNSTINVINSATAQTLNFGTTSSTSIAKVINIGSPNNPTNAGQSIIRIGQNSAIEFGAGINKEANAGRIAYGAFDSGVSLNIVGAGIGTNPRQVRIWDTVGINTPANTSASLTTANAIICGGSISSTSLTATGTVSCSSLTSTNANITTGTITNLTSTTGTISTLTSSVGIRIDGGKITKDQTVDGLGTTDLGLYSATASGWIRFVTNGGRFQFSESGGTGGSATGKLYAGNLILGTTPTASIYPLNISTTDNTPGLVFNRSGAGNYSAGIGWDGLTRINFYGKNGGVDTTPFNSNDVIMTLTTADGSSNAKLGINNTAPTSKITVNAGLDHTTLRSESQISITQPTQTSSTAINDPKAVLSFQRQGTTNQSWASRASFKLCRYENVSTNARTRLDLTMAHGQGTNDDVHVMSIQSNSYVGIGKTDPSQALDVVGSVKSDTSIIIKNASIISNSNNSYSYTIPDVSSGNFLIDNAKQSPNFTNITASSINFSQATLNKYQNTFYITTIGGAVSSSSYSPVYSIIGKTVTISFYGYTTTAVSATTINIGALPTEARPMAMSLFPIIVQNLGSNLLGLMQITSDGIITIYRDLNRSSFQTGGVCGIPEAININYLIA